MTIALRAKILRDPERYRAAFFGPRPTNAHCYEMTTHSEGRGVGAVVIADVPPTVPLLEGFFPLARYWRETASQGWIGGPQPVDPERVWTSLWNDIETGHRGYVRQIYQYEFRPMKLAEFARELDTICEMCVRGATDVENPRVVVDNVRELADPRGFRPEIRGRYLDALAVLLKWNERVLVARTTEQQVLVIWSTSC